MSSPAQPDHYGTLEIGQTASAYEIKRAYKRLALLRHPDKNPGNPDACIAFCKLQEAFEVLHDNHKRSIYDISYAKVKADWEAYQSTQKDKRAAESVDKAWEEQKQKEKRTREARKLHLTTIEHSKRLKLQEFEERARELESQVQEYARTEKDILEKIENKGLWGYLTSWTVKAEVIADNKLQLEREKHQASAARRVKEHLLEQEKQKIRTLQGEVQELVFKLQQLEREEARDKAERARRAWEKAEKENAARYRDRMARAKEQADREARAREKARQEQAAKERERQRVAREKAEVAREKAKKLAREEEEARRQAEEAHEKWMEELFEAARAKASTRAGTTRPTPNFRRNRTREPPMTSTGTGRNACLHRGYWPKREDSATCENCGRYYRSWILTCPGCQMEACASCRPLLQGKPSRPRRTPNDYDS